MLRRARPDLVDFLEIGADVARGIDEHGGAWVAQGLPTTYHFLDVNLEEPEDLDNIWLDTTVHLARTVRAAWLCGDAGMWHVGPRDHGHGTLLPPIFCESSLASMAEAVITLRERSGFEVLPENPPAQVLVGNLHPLEYFGALAERADCGMLLDVAHLAITQRALNLPPTTLLELFPVERVVEIHIAGGTEYEHRGRVLIHDDHGPAVHEDTWQILEALVPRATSLRAVVVECERNSLPTVIDLFERVRARMGAWPTGDPVPTRPVFEIQSSPVDHRRLQRTLFQMLVDPGFAEQVRTAEPDAWLAQIDPALLSADPQGVRIAQLLGNVTLEFFHTVRAAPDIVGGFPRSAEFHVAISGDTPLPLAFARYAATVLPDEPLPRALLALDGAMADLRRAPDGPAPLPAVAPSIAPSCRLLRVPAGTYDAAVALREGRPPAPLGDTDEHLLLIGGPRGPDARRGVDVEIVTGPVAQLLGSGPLSPERLAAFADAHGAEPADVEALVDGLRADGVVFP